jgi:hypothetical protein
MKIFLDFYDDIRNSNPIMKRLILKKKKKKLDIDRNSNMKLNDMANSTTAIQRIK